MPPRKLKTLKKIKFLADFDDDNSSDEDVG